MFRVNEKSIYHRYATLSFLPLHSSGILIYIYIYIYIYETTRHLKFRYISILTNLLRTDNETKSVKTIYTFQLRLVSRFW